MDKYSEKNKLLAHISENGRVQTLMEHCIGAKSLCQTFGSKIGLGNTAALCGLLHDMGKATNTFQEYLMQKNNMKRGDINHSTAGGKYIFSLSDKNNSYSVLTAQIISLAVISHHHQGLYDVISTDGDDILGNRLNPNKDIFYDEALNNFNSSNNEVSKKLEAAIEEIRLIYSNLYANYPHDGEALAFSMGLVVRFLLSCLLDADRFDTYLFTRNKTETEISNGDFFHNLSSELEKKISEFDNSRAINKERNKISKQCLDFSKNNNGIFQLHVPTGGGKTISSLRYAVNCAKTHGKERIFYIAPYKSILEQNSDVIRKIFHDDKENILEHHSDIVSNNDDYKLLTQRWSSKIILTTMVQFLDTLFASKSSSVRRFHSLANSVIIIDEAQSIPVNCIYMFNTAINFLANQCGCSVVLCTATQPQLHKTEHPIQLSDNCKIVDDTQNIFKAFKRTTLHDLTTSGEFSTERLSEFVMEKHEDNKRILVIMNTKSDALKIYNYIKKRHPTMDVHYLSTGLCPANRRKVLKSLYNLKEVICVSTQLIEAGVDISFSCVIRSLAGLDSIAQAAGRCNRENEAENGNVYIIKSATENLDKLTDIKQGQKATINVLAAFNKNPEKYDNDLLSVEAMEKFYSYYYTDRERNNEMNYPVSKSKTGFYQDTNLYDLLSYNKTGRDTLMQKGGKPYILNQAFYSAGSNYKSIESGGMGVLVPYGNCTKLIDELCKTSDIKVKLHLLRKLQQYSVNLFQYEMDFLKKQNALLLIEQIGVYLVDDDYYDHKCGIKLVKAGMDTCIL